MSAQRETDKKWMRQALDIAKKGRGYVSPNPLVGCIIVSENGKKIGEGYHESFGNDHAEVNALSSVSDREMLKGATVYVTLEPCAHHGKTPPCAPLLADLPIERVVIAAVDPNPEVNGKGIEILKDAGKTVATGIMKGEAQKQNEFFFHFQETGKPFITLKIAQTVDGYIAAPDGESQWISGPESRTLVHKWRSEYDAVMVGSGTALADNPQLTVRHVEGRQPKRIVIDGSYSLPKELNLFSDRHEEKTIILTWNKEASANDADPMLKMMQSNYFRGEIIQTAKANGHVNLREALIKLGEKNITSILVEGGQKLSSALLREGLVDKIELFIAPKLLGGGTRSVLDLGINHMKHVRDLKEISWSLCGKDMLLTGYI